MFDLTWEEKLKFLVDQDHQMREILIERGVLPDTYHKEMEKVHLNNARILSELIENMGFPVLSNAGEKGVRFSWLIIHHAISWPTFMKESLFQIRLAVAANDYIPELLAYLEDRILFFEGTPQLYGTNMDWINGELKRTPIEDPQHVDARRRALGLPNLSPEPQVTFDKPPKNPEAKELEFRSWLVRVGWRSA
jgi:hypothetical protein